MKNFLKLSNKEKFVSFCLNYYNLIFRTGRTLSQYVQKSVLIYRQLIKIRLELPEEEFGLLKVGRHILLRSS